jgi:small subunit ribosomal protein S8
MHDSISDLLTRIRNAGLARHAELVIPHSRMKESISRILESEGYVTGVTVVGKAIKHLKIVLKYNDRQKVITGLKRISSPGLRRYVGSNDIPRVLGGMGIAILSTSNGFLTGTEARKQNVGGELVCFVW